MVTWHRLLSDNKVVASARGGLQTRRTECRTGQTSPQPCRHGAMSHEHRHAPPFVDIYLRGCFLPMGGAGDWYDRTTRFQIYLGALAHQLCPGQITRSLSYRLPRKTWSCKNREYYFAPISPSAKGNIDDHGHGIERVVRASGSLAQKRVGCSCGPEGFGIFGRTSVGGNLY